MIGCNSGIKKADLESSDFQTLRLSNLRLLYLFFYKVSLYLCVSVATCTGVLISP